MISLLSKKFLKSFSYYLFIWNIDYKNDCGMEDLMLRLKRIMNNPMGIFLLIFFIFLFLFIASYFSKSTLTYFNGSKKAPIYSVDTQEKKVAITFDSNWGEDNTEEILEILDKYNVKATFFLVGKWIDDYPEKAERLFKKGHELGNHSNTHADLTRVSKTRIIQEIQLGDNKIMNITGEFPKLFRCPSGAYNDLVVDTIQENNHYCIQWNVDSIDWKEQGSDIEYNRVIKKVKPGSILLFHNNAKYTPKNLSRIIENLQNQGYTFVKVGDLIYTENYYIDHLGNQISK